MIFRSPDRVGIFLTFALAMSIAFDADAAKPRIVVQAGQTVDGGWEILDIGPRVALNNADQIVYVANIRKGNEIKVAAIRDRERMVWEGKQLADGSLVIDIAEDACPAINASGAIAVYGLIRKDGLQREALIGPDEAYTWVGREVGGGTITRLVGLRPPSECAQIDDRGRVAYTADFASVGSGGRAVLLDNRTLVTIGDILSDGSQVAQLFADVAVNGAGRIVVSAGLEPRVTALINGNAVLLRNGDLALDGTTIRLPTDSEPDINDRGQIAASVGILNLSLPGGAIVTRDRVLLRADTRENPVVLPDGASIDHPSIGGPAIDRRGNVAVRANVDHEGYRDLPAILTPKGVTALEGDLIGALPISDLQPPAINGAGRVAFVALAGDRRAVILGKPTRNCVNLLTADVPVPDGFGAAYNVFIRTNIFRELIVRVHCGFGAAMLLVGSGRSDERINPEAFVSKGGELQPIELRGGERDADGWFIGSATANLKLTGTQLLRENEVLAQTCFVDETRRRCGCRDVACDETLWQLQRFQRPR
jgi:hypothetical protein